MCKAIWTVKMKVYSTLPSLAPHSFWFAKRTKCGGNAQNIYTGPRESGRDSPLTRPTIKCHAKLIGLSSYPLTVCLSTNYILACIDDLLVTSGGITSGILAGFCVLTFSFSFETMAVQLSNPKARTSQMRSTKKVQTGIKVEEIEQLRIPVTSKYGTAESTRPASD
ncbi:hypothetical protein BJ912DRAFT_1108840 [Pholiota molesta]|nr:hypothetical protein BJ912DRAFT_1108840 [Pholiota molesta]